MTGFSKEVKSQAAKRPESLKTRVAALEKEVAALWEVVNRLDGVGPSYLYAGIEDAKEKRPGPDKRIEDAELFRGRDGLVLWLEEVWPELVQPLLAAANSREVAAVLRKAARPKDLQPPWQTRFLAHPAKLGDFLQSEKFRIKPPKKTVADALNRPDNDERRRRAANRLPTRQIANAMAGVPKLSWRTSMDRCSNNPCPYPVSLNASRHFWGMYRIPPD